MDDYSAVERINEHIWNLHIVKSVHEFTSVDAVRAYVTPYDFNDRPITYVVTRGTIRNWVTETNWLAERTAFHVMVVSSDLHDGERVLDDVDLTGAYYDPLAFYVLGLINASQFQAAIVEEKEGNR